MPVPPLPVSRGAVGSPVLPAVPAPGGPQPSVPVPGVRRSLPVPPIPGRDLPTSTGSTAVRRVRTPPSPARRRFTRAVFALLALLGVVVAAYGGLYVYGDRALGRVDALVPDGPEVLAPQLQVGAETSLVVTSGLPGRSGLASVSALVAHVAEDGQVVVVTLPPTAFSDTPACRAADGSLRPPATEPFADALLQGGPSCLVRSVQQLTGLRVDHYVGVDAARLPGLVEVLGEVDMCPTVGEQQLAGTAVADHLRPGGAGSDVTGAVVGPRGQQVLSSTLTAGLTGGALADPLTLARFLSGAGDTLTVDEATSLQEVRSLGLALGPQGESTVEVAELPVAQVGRVAAGSDQAAVVIDALATRELFDEVINSGRLPVPEPPAEGQPADAAQAAAPAGGLVAPVATDPVPAGTTVTVPPEGVTVDVLDATGTGRTAEVADGLAAGGFRIGARGVEPGAVDRTVVRYGPAALEPARTVATAVPGAVLVETAAVGAAVQLVVGPDYTGLAAAPFGTPVPATAVPPAADDAGRACTS
ncbi:LytR C-terminal domain-containing protein [Modestobacter sp. VKM Ac-2986]|uniref:LCP family protein n=1 Tax=Modestobacter sp. VKM Ac-2986 TaxID=3004140 RepID=UPI0022AB0A70|nr:LytR C-terminal domain-containing protein [Modestobacter sp. VKM Ac-2986]MCZ2827849.1 LytR C-terminal domain-containing protein [Modestobacter sp. VKM Ac-2986]